MAKEAHAKKYLILDSVRVFYDDKTDSVHLTAKDEDFEQSDQFHVVLSKGTPTERTLRKLLNKHQFIENSIVHPFPKHVYIEDRDSVCSDMSDYAGKIFHNIPLGIYRNKKECVWDVASSPHLFVKGATGSGKSSIGKVIGYHVKRFAKDWELYGLDTQFQFSSHDMNFVEVAKDLKSAQKLLESLIQELSHRYERLEAEGVTNYCDLQNKPKAIMFLVEDFNLLITESNPENMPRFEYLQHELAREIIIKHLIEISRLGRSAGIHMAIFSTTDIDPRLQELQSNIINRITFGVAARGRGTFDDGREQREFQAYALKS